jgi:hypothetical protein
LCPSVGYYTLKMEVADLSETFVSIYQPIWHHTQEDHNLNIHPHENVKSRYVTSLWEGIFSVECDSYLCVCQRHDPISLFSN